MQPLLKKKLGLNLIVLLSIRLKAESKHVLLNKLFNAGLFMLFIDDIYCDIILLICLILNELVFTFNSGLSIKQSLKKADVIKLLLTFKNIKYLTFNSIFLNMVQTMSSLCE